MNENSPYRNPEAARIENLRKEQERLSYEARQRAEEPAPPELKARQQAYRAEILRRLLARIYQDKPESWREAYLRHLQGLPDPKPAPVPAAYNAINKRIAARFGIELAKGNQIQYR